MKPLKRIVCWIIGHNWLPSHYDMAAAREQEHEARKRLQKEEIDLGSQGEGQESQ